LLRGLRHWPRGRRLPTHGPLVVRFYDQRFAIGLTGNERKDLGNFLEAL
jgi:hypothetical protein